MSELKPCPFCGLVSEHKPSCFFTLEKVAMAYPPDAFVDAGGPEALEDAWNTRATDAELERLRGLLSDIKEWEISRADREPLFVLPTELRARIQAAIDEARKG